MPPSIGTQGGGQQPGLPPGGGGGAAKITVLQTKQNIVIKSDFIFLFN